MENLKPKVDQIKKLNEEYRAGLNALKQKQAALIQQWVKDVEVRKIEEIKRNLIELE